VLAVVVAWELGNFSRSRLRREVWIEDDGEIVSESWVARACADMTQVPYHPDPFLSPYYSVINVVLIKDFIACSRSIRIITLTVSLEVASLDSQWRYGLLIRR
jgi:hypothetical protein